jgi:raffinose/stachyose/melibiose transport system substrate-binding protein
MMNALRSRLTAAGLRGSPARMLAAVTLVSALVAGCGSSSSTSQNAATSKGLGGPMTGQLTLWSWDDSTPGFARAFAQIDKQFEAAHPGVTIKRVVQPYPNYAQLMQATFTAGSGPCAAEFLVGQNGPAVLHFADGLVPLNAQVTPTMRSQLTGLDTVSTGYSPSGTIYALPFGLQPQVLYYNRKLFKKAGLNPAQPPATYAQLVADTKTLKAAGITPFAGGNQDGFMSEWWFSYLYPGFGTAEQSLQLATGKLAFSAPSVSNTISHFLSLVRGGSFAANVDSEPLVPDAANDFAAGKGAMYVGLGSGSTASYVPFDQSLGGANVGVAEAVGETSAPSYLPGGPAGSWGIPRYCKNKQLAYDYIQYSTGPAATQLLWQDDGLLPGNTAVSLPASASVQPREMAAAFRSHPFLYMAHGLWSASVDNAFRQQMELAVGGHESASQVVSALQSAASAP